MAPGLAYSVAGGGDVGVVKALFELRWLLDMFAAIPAALFVVRAPRDELGEGWLLVAYRRVPLRPHPRRDALDTRDEHHSLPRSAINLQRRVTSAPGSTAVGASAQ
jgi:hypothetical protein